MASLRAWVQAARPLAAGNVLVPVAWGALWASRGTTLDTAGLGFALLWGWLDQLYIVFANDLADEQADAMGQGSLMSGGSRVLVDKKISRAALARAAAASAAALALLSFALAHTRDASALPWLAATALALLWAYSFAPLRRSYRGGGMLLQAFGMGVVLPAVGWSLQGRALVDLPPLVLLGPVLLAAASHLFTALPDVVADRRANKRTRAVRLGEPRVRAEAFALTALAALAAMPTQGLPIAWAVGAALSVGAAWRLARRFVYDPVGRLRFSLTGLALNMAVWICFMVCALRLA